MNIVVIGAGAMGSAIGAQLARTEASVTLIDVSPEIVETINAKGLRIDDKAGNSTTTRLRAALNADGLPSADLVIVFVKCYHTETAVRGVLPVVGPQTVVLSLQNGWGNGPRIADIVGDDKLLLGVCYHSATVLGPGHVLHAGRGMTFIGEPAGSMTARLQAVGELFKVAGVDVTLTANVLREIWSKLSLNAATLPNSAITRVTADRLLDTEDMRLLMQSLLREVVSVAQAQRIQLELDERWAAISSLLQKLAPNTKGSMLQDVERGRRTEIDVINGAIVDAGARLGIPTPYNHALVALIKALEQTFHTKV